MYVSVGEMRHRIKILRPVMTIDDAGNSVIVGTAEVVTVWAKVLPYTAKISDGTAEVINKISYRIIIRYFTDVRVTDFVLWEGRRLALSAPPYPMDGKHRWLVMECGELIEDDV